MLEILADPTVVGAILGAIIAGGSAVIAVRHRPARLQLVDVSFGTKADGWLEFPTVSLVVQNAGGREVTITQVEVTLMAVKALRGQIPEMSALVSTAEYDFVIDPAVPLPYTFSRAVAQAIDAHESDRFDVALRPTDPGEGETLFHLRVALVFNGSRRTQAKDLVVAMPDRARATPKYFASEFMAERKKFLQSPHLPGPATDVLAMIYKDVDNARRTDKMNRATIQAFAEVLGFKSPRVRSLIQLAEDTKEASEAKA